MSNINKLNILGTEIDIPSFDNKQTLDGFSETEEGKLLWNDEPIDGGEELPNNIVCFDDTEDDIQFNQKDIMVFLSDLNFSKDEQLTGKRWIDGKPIYQKTFDREDGAPNLSDLDIETIIYYTNHIKKPTGNYVQNGKWYNGSNVTQSIILTNNYIQTDNNAGGEVFITIYYTRKSDSETSPVNIPTIDKIPFKFGITEDGQYGYYKVGADTVTPFKMGASYELLGEYATGWGGRVDFSNDTNKTQYIRMTTSMVRSWSYCEFYVYINGKRKLYGDSALEGGLNVLSDISHIILVLKPSDSGYVTAQSNTQCSFEIYSESE